MNTINDIINHNLLNGDKLVPNFSREIKQMTGFQVGDIFTIPCEFNVFARRVNGTIYGEYIFVTNQNGEVRELYPSQITRRVGVYEDGIFTGNFVQGQGSVNEYSKEFVTIADLMDSLKGKTIRVTEKAMVKSKYGYRSVYSFDFV